jgi:hypothetical protein
MNHVKTMNQRAEDAHEWRRTSQELTAHDLLGGVAAGHKVISDRITLPTAQIAT